MDDQLLLLRKESYAAGLEYDRALIEYSDSLNEVNYGAAETAVVNHHTVASKYGRILARLSEHLLTMPQTTEVGDEFQRTQKLLELLDREIDAAQHHLRALREKLHLEKENP